MLLPAVHGAFEVVFAVLLFLVVLVCIVDNVIMPEFGLGFDARAYALQCPVSNVSGTSIGVSATTELVHCVCVRRAKNSQKGCVLCTFSAAYAL